MSHFTTLKVMLKDKHVVDLLCKRHNLTREKVDVYVNPWSFTNESIKNCTVFKDVKGTVVFVTEKNGTVHHDGFYMGQFCNTFLTDYSKEFIKKTAKAEGGIVHEKGVDQEGNIILEVEYYD